VKISKGLKQAYALQDFTFGAVQAFQASLTKDGKLEVSRTDATAISSLVKAWEMCQERVRIHRGKPLPGSLKHDQKGKQRGKAESKPVAPLVFDGESAG